MPVIIKIKGAVCFLFLEGIVPVVYQGAQPDEKALLYVVGRVG